MAQNEIIHDVQTVFDGTNYMAKYISDLFSIANLTDSKIVNTLTELNTCLTPHDGKPFCDFTLYRHLVGNLVYLTVTRPDISYAVDQVSQFMAAPRSTHFSAVLRILRYLKGTLFDGSISPTSLLFSCMLTLMLIGRVIRQIVALPLVTIAYLAPHLSLGEVRNKLLLLDLALRQNIVL
ncbi:uncharacterized mitochondrial protein AtMg00240-like [Corylus avellana]|uniref:uncharacterized mitochondrial protein AtMg00240-like n=1 Tax=Corylus avellana TaxID=13451 RepID=UPI00286BC671|nr:uncharacterized mitochondrial protein AtMg00240-like [Corylus avellana]